MSEAKHTPGEWFWSGDTLMANRDHHSESVLNATGAKAADKALIAVAPEMFAFIEQIAKRDPVFAKGWEKQHIKDAAALIDKAKDIS